MIKVKNEVKVYELNGKDVGFDDMNIEVESHWNESSKVVLIINGEKITVAASDIKAAIDNATNTNRYS